MREVVILGIGMHKAGEFPDKTNLELGRAATFGALRDAGMEFKDLQSAYFSKNKADPTASIGEMMLGRMGLTGMPVVNLENDSCSGSSAFWLAYNAVAFGRYDISLAVGVETLVVPPSMSPPPPPATEYEAALRAMGIADISTRAALAMRRRMHDYGETVGQFARVSVKNHKNAAHYPYAQRQKEVTLDEVLNSLPICDPLTLLQCCPPLSEGCAAAVLCSKDVAKRYQRGKNITVASAVLRTASESTSGVGLTAAGLSKSTAKEAYNIAGIGIDDIDLIELCDPFTVNEVIHYEDLGLCDQGEGGRIAGDGRTDIGGERPVNTDGGLLARGHPSGCTGLYQIAELVLQLRGQAGPRQVSGAKVGLAHLEGSGPVATVIILKR